MEYKDLEVWKKAKQLFSSVYQITKQINEYNDRFITQQILRSCLSISSNIAEATGRQYKKDSLQFLNIARGSLYETESIIEILLENKLIEKEQYDQLMLIIIDLRKLLNGTIRYFKSDKLIK